MERYITQDKGIIDAVKLYRAATVLERDVKEEKDNTRNKILHYMETCNVTTMEAGRSLVKITRYSTSKLDVAQLKKDFPEIAAQYSTVTESVRLTILDA